MPVSLSEFFPELSEEEVQAFIDFDTKVEVIEKKGVYQTMRMFFEAMRDMEVSVEILQALFSDKDIIEYAKNHNLNEKNVLSIKGQFIDNMMAQIRETLEGKDVRKEFYQVLANFIFAGIGPERMAEFFIQVDKSLKNNDSTDLTN